MQYVLMNKNIPVVELSGYMGCIQKIYNPEYLPIGVNSQAVSVMEGHLYKWWLRRTIPANRYGLRTALYQMDMMDVQELINKSFCLSLSDQYWMKPSNMDIKWEDINFFENDFSKDVGNALFNKSFSKRTLNVFSPDITTVGWLKKKWVVLNGERYLLKAGSKPFLQEPLNEVIATKILEQTTGIEYVSYDLYKEKNDLCSRCKNFITKDTEFVSAYNLFSSIDRGEREKYEHLLYCAEQYKIPKVKEFLNDMIILDYIILNTDRHWGNFGFIRNVHTLEFEGPAPIFDNGTSLWNNDLKIISQQEPSKSFKSSHREQIALVNDFNRFDIQKIRNNIVDIGERVFKQGHNIDSERGSMLLNGLENRIRSVAEIMNQ